MSKRPPVLYRLEIDPEALAALKAVRVGHALGDVERASRLLRWFLAQDPVVQALAIGLLSEQEVARIAATRSGVDGHGANGQGVDGHRVDGQRLDGLGLDGQGQGKVTSTTED